MQVRLLLIVIIVCTELDMSYIRGNDDYEIPIRSTRWVMWIYSESNL